MDSVYSGQLVVARGYHSRKERKVRHVLGRRRLVVAVIATMVFAALAGAALADQEYSDSRGDAGAGTDITNMTVRNDPAGMVSFQIASATAIVANHAVAVFVDSDKNAGTGFNLGPVGVEYYMFGGPETGVAFLAWNGSTFVEANPASFSVGAAAANVTDFRISRSDLGNTTGFNFLVISISIDGEEVNFWDFAPDSGSYAYDLAISQCSNGQDDDGDGKIDAADLGCSGTTDNDESDDPVTLKAGKASVKPAKPKAGTRVVVSVPVTRVETGNAIDGGAVACTAKIVGGKAFRGAGKVAAGRAVCTFKVPLTAKSKLVRGTVAVSFETATARAPFSFRVA